MTSLRVTPPLALSSVELNAWRTLATSDPRFESPFLHPDYSRALALFRPNLEVAVVSETDGPSGFLAYERHGRSARPLGIKLADFQGFVSGRASEWDAPKLLKSAGLSTCAFDHLVSSGSVFEAGVVRLDDSPFIDLTQGYRAYLDVMKAKGSTLISQVQRKRRKFEREVGTLEFTWRDHGDDAWEALLSWKTAQRQRTKTFNILEFPWVRNFLRHVSRLHADGVQGTMSTLRANGRVVAVHMGMRGGRRLHYWFPAYDPEFSRFSPGLILLLAIAEHAGNLGVARIDLGKGDDGYKASFASDAEPVGTAILDLCAPRRMTKVYWMKLRSWIKSSRLKSAVQLPKRIIRRLQAQATMGST